MASVPDGGLLSTLPESSRDAALQASNKKCKVGKQFYRLPTRSVIDDCRVDTNYVPTLPGSIRIRFKPLTHNTQLGWTAAEPEAHLHASPQGGTR
jgi:hypothetical protein